MFNPLTHKESGGGGAVRYPPPALFFCPVLKISLGNHTWKFLILQNFLLRMPLWNFFFF